MLALLALNKSKAHSNLLFINPPLESQIKADFEFTSINRA
jgi:hypothetical protein